MSKEVRLSRIDTVLEALEYPISRESAGDSLDDVTLVLADGEADLATLIEQTSSDRFNSVDDLEMELHSVLPREAVGEPYQSEGEG